MKQQVELQKNTINPQYLKQTFFNAFSSKDLVSWEKHSHVLDIKNVSWAAYSIWAPSIIQANDKYYLFFGANDIQNNNEMGGIGVAVADNPAGPFIDTIGDSPFGPFERIGKVLQQDPSIATGAGHHSVINIPNTDEYYIVYHRRPLGTTNGNHREICIDEMTFDKDGFINPVKMTTEGVKKRVLNNE